MARPLLALLLALACLGSVSAAGEWGTVTFLDSTTVAMPGTPSRTWRPASELGRSYESFRVKDGGYEYSASLSTSPPGGEAYTIDRHEAEFMAEDMHGKVIRLEESASGDMKGWDLEFVRSRRGDRWYVRWLSGGRRTVQLVLITPESRPSRATARKFFDSLAPSPAE